MSTMDPEVRAFEQEIWDANLAAMKQLPKDWPIYTRVVEVEFDGQPHVIARYADPNRPGIILAVNLDPDRMGVPHSTSEPGAYVMPEVGTDHGFQMMRAIGRALGVAADYFDKRSL